MLLCEGYRYRVSATLRSLKAKGFAALVVTGGAENGNATLLPAPLNVTLGADEVTLTTDFEVHRRWSTAQVALHFGGGANAGNIVEILQLTLCPVPSRAQYCEAGPRQAPASRLESLAQGGSRVTAINQNTGVAAVGYASFVREGLPPYRSRFQSEVRPLWHCARMCGRSQPPFREGPRGNGEENRGFQLPMLGMD